MKPTTLQDHAELLDQWLEQDQLSMSAARRRLAKLGCTVSAGELRLWQAARRQELLLGQIARCARECREVEQQLDHYPAPELETIIKLHRVLLLKFSAEANVAPEMLKFVKELMKPVMDWARLQEKRKDRETEQQRRQAGDGDALSAETLEKIERELNLL